ncbi:chitin synthase-domain-containing protein [Umbelopsis sp. AD052]|nr:chitin synthase-domain-containing protein [Umbelopsis sp. AD052]
MASSSPPPPPVPSHGIPEPTLHPSNEVEVNESAQRTLQRSDSSTSRVQRKKSLVRPERERIDPSHRQYHYRQRAAEHASRDGPFAASTTGNAPIYTAGSEEGKSILGREDPDSHKERKQRSQATDAQVNNTAAPPVDRTPSVSKPMHPMEKDVGYKEPKQWPSCWYMYSMVVSIWIPNFILSTFGVKEKPRQRAFREKIGLLSIILLICGAVGFLTFGFTQTVCPKPPLRFQIGYINSGYLIINGWAYQLATWDHPAIPGQTNTSTNPLYPPVNAGGMDASFLFQNVNQKCLNVITPKPGVNIGQSGNMVPTYFPCRLFNPNETIAPSYTTYSNYSGCHLTANERQQYSDFVRLGVPNNKGSRDKGGQVYYTWQDLTSKPNLVAFNGYVLNLNLLQSLPPTLFDTPANGLIQTMLASVAAKNYSGQDITRMVNSRRGTGNWPREAECLTDIIKVGFLDTETIGCFASDIVLYCSLVVILAVIGVKFGLAILFGWFLSWRLGNFGEEKSYRDRMKRNAEIEDWTEGIYEPARGIRPRNMSSFSYQEKRKSFLPQTSRFTQPEPMMFSERPTSPYIAASPPFSPSPRLSPLQSPMQSRTRDSVGSMMALMPLGSSQDSNTSDSSSQNLSACPFPLSKYAVPLPSPDYKPFGFPLIPTICLVTCYSEGEEGLRTTIDSIATTDYPNSHKIILVVCDGVITGAGNSKSTPDICLGMMRNLLVPKEQTEPLSYVAVADGIHKHNMAKVFAGYYKYDDTTVDRRKQQRVPMITIVKCGTPIEANDRKPGNRGKRDSQVLLMNFLQKAMFDERMTSMEYEIFNSFWRLTNISADKYEICLMVDADTKIYPDSLSRMVSCMAKDPTIAGLCGETKIGNKTDSWVTMIQVFEYYIAHHQSKAFESVFGGVTCLPGCFCMYRIKAPKGPSGYWVPILANPDVIERYQENVVDTLHKKNLLLLGEDRYLSTLMLSTFPNRKMLFCPQAVCKTVVPDTFRILLSQRRRWINSTVHNLMELVMVRDLCGTFCFSMQFIVFMELVGTVALPAAISFTLFLIIRAIMGAPAEIPLILLALILGLPAVLIAMTSRKVIYVAWMLIYLLSLPIWNFLLPVWAYWHFDDFTWGETRRVVGAEKDTHHGDKFGEFDSSQIVMKRWTEFERDRRLKMILQQQSDFAKVDKDDNIQV